MVCCDSQVTAHIQLISASDYNAVEPGNGRLADIPHHFVKLNEFVHPLIIILWVTYKILLLLRKVCACRKRLLAGSGKNNNCNRIVPRGIFERSCKFPDCCEVE